MKIDIYSKDACSFCIQAKSLVKQKCLDFNEFIIGKDIQIPELQTKVGSTPVRTAPQIFVNDAYVGGFIDLKTYLSNYTGCSV
jgi:glutaredoxin 3